MRACVCIQIFDYQKIYEWLISQKDPANYFSFTVIFLRGAPYGS